MNKKIDAYERIKELYEFKKKNHCEAENEKIAAIEKILKRKSSFFEMTAEVAYKILYYLGIPKEELHEVYNELTSIKNYQKYVPKIRTILPDGVEIDGNSLKR